jgi:hypothetical protein
MSARPQKITFAEMRGSGVRGILVYCSDYRCRRAAGFQLAGSAKEDDGLSIMPALRGALDSIVNFRKHRCRGSRREVAGSG